MDIINSKEWPTIKLAKLCSIIPGKKCPKARFVSSGCRYYDGPFFKGRVDEALCPGGSIVVSKKPSASYFNFELCLSAIWHGPKNIAIVPNNLVDASYLCCFLVTLDLDKYLTAKHPRQLDVKALLDIDVPFPFLETQKSLSMMLDCWSEMKANAEFEIYAKLGETDYQFWKKAEKTIKKLKGKDCLRRKLGEIGRIVKGRTLPDGKSEYYNGRYSYFTLNDVDENRFTSTTIEKLSAEGFRNAVQIPKDSVLLARNAHVEVPYLTTEKCSCSGDVYAVIPNKRKVLPKYLYYAMSTPEYAESFSGEDMGLRRQFDDFEIYVPGLDAQRAIVTVLDGLHAVYVQKLSKYKSMIKKLQERHLKRLKKCYYDCYRLEM